MARSKKPNVRIDRLQDEQDHRRDQCSTNTRRPGTSRPGYRLPGVPMGLAMSGTIRKSKPGDLEDQHAWLDRMQWFYIDEET